MDQKEAKDLITMEEFLSSISGLVKDFKTTVDNIYYKIESLNQYVHDSKSNTDKMIKTLGEIKTTVDSFKASNIISNNAIASISNNIESMKEDQGSVAEKTADQIKKINEGVDKLNEKIDSYVEQLSFQNTLDEGLEEEIQNKINEAVEKNKETK